MLLAWLVIGAGSNKPRCEAIKRLDGSNYAIQVSEMEDGLYKVYEGSILRGWIRVRGSECVFDPLKRNLLI